jgi:hypothetical protein
MQLEVFDIAVTAAIDLVANSDDLLALTMIMIIIVVS